jgi:DNA-binding NtrC family response regulator
LGRRHRLPPKGVSEAGKQRLLAYPWPGNVRELAHELERALVFEEGDELGFEQLKTEGHAASATPRNRDDWFNESYVFPEEGFALEEAINRLIHQALKQSGNNVSGAARLLGVSRDFVRYRLSGQKSPGNLGE